LLGNFNPNNDEWPIVIILGIIHLAYIPVRVDTCGFTPLEQDVIKFLLVAILNPKFQLLQ
jgi:hypothetical protein